MFACSSVSSDASPLGQLNPYVPPALPPPSQLTKLRLQELESRDVPALYSVHLTTPGVGMTGDTAATISGSLNVNSALATDANGGTLVEASSIQDALERSIVGTVTVQHAGETLNYSMGLGMTGVNAAAHKPFRVGATAIELEDMASSAQGSDWDYNDHYWSTSVALVPADSGSQVFAAGTDDGISTPPMNSLPTTPTAIDDTLSLKHDRTTLIKASDLLGNDTLPAGTWKIVVTQDATHGTLFGSEQSSSFVDYQYNPDTEYTGADVFKYYVTDGTQFSNIATVNINVTNVVPTAKNISFVVPEDGTLNIQGGQPIPGSPTPTGDQGLLRSASDADNDALRSILVTSVSHGMLDLKDNGGFNYLPDPNFTGVDTFTYKVSDGVTYSDYKTVTIQVTPYSGLDLDGHDKGTKFAWMRESEEQQKGLGVSLSDSATILARAPKPPNSSPGWVLKTRSVIWSSSTLTVNGQTSASTINLMGSSGDVVLTVTGKSNGTPNSSGLPGGLGSISYTATWENSIDEGGVAMICGMQVGPKAILYSVETTSDQRVLLNNTSNVLDVKDCDVYHKVQFATGLDPNPLFEKYDAPISQVKQTNTTVEVRINASGLKVGDTFKLKGASSVTGFTYESAIQAVGAASGDYTIPITSSAKLENKIQEVNAAITWTLVINPNAATESSLAVGASKQRAFILYGTPASPDGTKAFKPLTIRMVSAVKNVGDAFDTSLNNGLRPIPTIQRIAFETLQLHKFNLKVNIASKLDDKTSGWLVPDYWFQPYNTGAGNLKNGSDCVSGAIYVNLAVSLTGVSLDSAVKRYTAPKPANPAPDYTVPVDYTQEWKGKTNPALAEDDFIVSLEDRSGGFNKFEACVIIKSGNTTFILPSGAGKLVYTDPKHVLTIFKQLGGYRIKDSSLIGIPYATYGLIPAPTVNID